MEKFSDWLESNWERNNLMPPSLDDQKALEFLFEYLVEDDFYLSVSIGREQANTELVGYILEKYSKKYKKELKQTRKRRKKEGLC